MAVIFVQDPLKESHVRLDDSRIEVIDELRQLALVGGRIAKSPTACASRRTVIAKRCFIIPTPSQLNAHKRDTSSSLNARIKPEQQLNFRLA